MTPDAAAVDEASDRRIVRGARGVLASFNRAGVLEPADIHVAQRLGRLGAESEQSVLLAVALAVRAVRAGSVCLDLAEVRQLSEEVTWPADVPWRQAISASPLIGARAIHLDGDLLYLDRYWGEEQQVVADLATRNAAAPPVIEEARLEMGLSDYFATSGYGDQRAAVERVARGWTTVVTGGPGSGKTTTVARMLGVLHAVRRPEQRALRVALAAPTGKAAARMVQAVQEATRQRSFPRRGDHRAAADAINALSATTLHRLLGWRPDSATRFRHDRANPLPHDVVIVDETSMISLTLMARLIEAVRPRARLVLVGDPDQLASVEAGAVLKDLVDGYARRLDSPVVRLGATRRFGADIGELATAIRAGEADRVLSLLSSRSANIEWLPLADLAGQVGARAVALAAAAETGDGAAALAELGRHRLLCAHREGPFGVAQWNRVAERHVALTQQRDWLPPWYVGRPFVVTGNDYGLKLWNGDAGVVCQSPDGSRAVVEDAGAQGRTLSVNRLAGVETAHAMTVHRSQGSQFDEVTVLLPEPESRILTRELFYTAVTRAHDVVRVVGSEESVRAAVTQRAARATGLARRL